MITYSSTVVLLIYEWWFFFFYNWNSPGNAPIWCLTSNLRAADGVDLLHQTEPELFSLALVLLFLVPAGVKIKLKSIFFILGLCKRSRGVRTTQLLVWHPNMHHTVTSDSWLQLFVRESDPFQNSSQTRVAWKVMIFLFSCWMRLSRNDIYFTFYFFSVSLWNRHFKFTKEKQMRTLFFIYNYDNILFLNITTPDEFSLVNVMRFCSV